MSGPVVLEEFLMLLSGSRSMTIQEIARATNLREGDLKRVLDALSRAGLIRLEGERAAIDPSFLEVLLSE